MNDIRTIVGTYTDPFSIAVVVSQFNEKITSALKNGAIERLIELGFSENDILLVEVPGAVEIPYAAQLIAKKQQVEVIIALGAVIRGDTSHYDYVCDQVSQGCQRVMLDNHIPVIFGVLTTDNEEQALERVGGSHGHKGRDAVDCAVAMHSIGKQL
ncbi:6,7-dimethyl-8-ribityllumazine synthase [Legionella waltersii]|uniref:6,7-dimethyl-8-ribityllumazine synthase n=1 Tax=Legionella waltersii TaxID=66969 RepID=A0A0W1A2U3_9GAMM|nr:6,7-dimethyl-8-ribityllumazine synthase [Legionella waltersii]KTD75608.1 riboflavin synthase beta chain (6,7-dimethyl-8-ribityllumazine synthase) [Legionella waltersii]SNV03159.1 riboflavin synthase subunit beta [Legionella waltersii]